MKVEVRRNWTYEFLNQRQQELADQIREGGEGAILLSEVAPVITVGRRTILSDILLTEDSLRNFGISLFRVDRGGFATYHGPGQWVLFIVDSLERLTGDSRGVRKAVDGLLSVAQRAAERLGVSTEIREGAELGLWTSRGKVAALGVQIKKGILLHGISVNGFKTAQSFQGLKPCGLDLPVDYLISEFDHLESRNKKFEKLGEELVRAAQEIFKVAES